MTVSIQHGDSPLVLSQPHGGTDVPKSIVDRLNETGRKLADTDWHIHRLYDGLIDNVTVVTMPFHRYVIDANRDPADVSLYPGMNTTSLCPTTDFEGQAIYLDGQEPSADEIVERLRNYHRPYHEALAEQLARIHQIHGYAILYDCHSIRSEIPFLFEGRLPDMSIGTNNGQSCSNKIESAVVGQCSGQNDFTHVLNGRFKGGWTTRHYGKPDDGYHAIQMELTQRNYMLEKAPWTFSEAKAEKLRDVLKNILNTIM